jgi:hypothetical protein
LPTAAVGREFPVLNTQKPSRRLIERDSEPLSRQEVEHRSRQRTIKSRRDPLLLSLRIAAKRKEPRRHHHCVLATTVVITLCGEEEEDWWSQTITRERFSTGIITYFFLT